MNDALLRLERARVHYGGIRALDEVDLTVRRGEIVALMGPNGAGKSTILRVIFGIAKLDSGSILLDNCEICPIPYQMAKKGVAFVSQGKRVFESLSVYENLMIGGILERDKREVAKRISRMMNLFPVLENKAGMKAGHLSGGEQQIVAISRGLIMRPSLLLLDEPSVGLSPKMLKDVFGKIREISESDQVAVLIVEHNIRSVLEIAHRAYVLDSGKVVAEGRAGYIAESGILEDLFLGIAVD